MNTKAIVVYLDDTLRCIEEFSWLYKTWKMWDLDTEYDLVVYHNPSCSDKIPNEPCIISKPLEPLHKKDSFWSDYPFVNSFAMFNDKAELNWVRERYTHILKTDCDVFLTQHFAGHTPQRILIGQGGYMPHEEEKAAIVFRNLERIRKKLKLNYSHLTHIGASLFGETKSVSHAIAEQFVITDSLLKTEWRENVGSWPGWFKGVASMYAIDLVVNHIFSHQHVSLCTLDEKCWKITKLNKNTLHIHAWHSAEYFSKHAWFKGEYKPLVLDKIPTNAAEYCHWVASNDLKTLKDVIEKSKT
jgi:hypothetical protein